jgi:murein DD-endopeptidase MepM/ murein hydrolase activator NlpD
MQRFPEDGVDIGIDAPLDSTGRVRPLDEVKRISPRWLAGAFLTGLGGAAMMGAAVLATIEGQSAAALASMSSATPQAALERAVITETPGTRSISAEAGDEEPDRQERLVKPVDIALAKRSFVSQAEVKSGDRELLQTQRFTRVSAPLEAYGSSGRAIPRFNPMVLISEANTKRDFNRVTTTEDPNADVSISTVDVKDATGSFSNLALDDADALAQASTAMSQPTATSVDESPMTMLERVMSVETETPQTDLIAFTPLPGSPFAKLEVRLVPENYAELPKSSGKELAILHREVVVSIDKDGAVAGPITKQNVKPSIAQAVEATLNDAVGKASSRPGGRLKLRFAMALTGETRTEDLVNVTLYADDQILAVVGRKDDGSFAIVPTLETAKADTDAKGERLTVFASIYETALRQDVPRPLVDELVRVYSYDVDFQRPVGPSDSIDFLYAEPEDGSKEQGELLHVGITLGNETKSYYRFQSGEDGEVDFYDPQGRSGRKFLLRMPLPSGDLRSGFGWRKHPILGYMKMHTGVDWANKVGTPIFAAGNGVVRKAAWDSGYGRRVEIDHANGYTTTYSHMSAFGDGIEDGVKVRQGQIIGYLGTSGLSTGPHLHYEVIVNDNFVDPMAIRLPRGKDLDGKQLNAFKAERDRVDGLMEKSRDAGGPDLAAASTGSP